MYLARETRLTDDQPWQVHLVQQLVLHGGSVHAVVPVKDIVHAHSCRKSGLKSIHHQRELVGARCALALEAQAVDGEEHDGQRHGHLKVHEEAHPAVVAGGRRGRPLRDGVVELGDIVLLHAVEEVQRRSGELPERLRVEVKAIDD